MKKNTLLAALLLTAATLSTAALAQDSTFEQDFVNRTILGKWQPANSGTESTAVSNDKRDADASLGVFGASIFGGYERVTAEVRSSGKATADSFTSQFN
ncbi:hypothetical protein A7981_08815 [Methylovorus sp. MM2]|uniref:hypothetical protein n=1 Tax=Methylovorus sp. MM2 TaxID=1848038 RepID=UPI0007DF81E9|nr:hypothetical protein [Methylovorus sp. MM2]OAM51571.1 hypothetical protein A7981_08815 [Methylovorus sp. MM2]